MYFNQLAADGCQDGAPWAEHNHATRIARSQAALFIQLSIIQRGGSTRYYHPDAKWLKDVKQLAFEDCRADRSRDGGFLCLQQEKIDPPGR